MQQLFSATPVSTLRTLSKTPGRRFWTVFWAVTAICGAVRWRGCEVVGRLGRGGGGKASGERGGRQWFRQRAETVVSDYGGDGGGGGAAAGDDPAE